MKVLAQRNFAEHRQYVRRVLGRLRLALCVCLIAVMSVACSRHKLSHPFGIGSPHLSVIRPTGAWTVAASAEFQGHRWTRYSAAASGDGICFSLDIDGRDAKVTALALGPPPPGTTRKLTHGVVQKYKGHVPWCAPPRVSNAANTSGVALAVGPRDDTSANYAFVTGIVPGASTAVAAFDDGSTQTAPVTNNTFALFFAPTRTIVRLDSIDAAGKTLTTCRFTPQAKGPPTLVAPC